MLNQAKSILKNTFGYDDFRPLQADVITHALNRKDCLVIMPTGGGKSLCYQIPGLILSGLTIVISPLISLMKDQVSQLKDAGADAAVLNSSLSSSEYGLTIQMLKNRQIKLLYVAPETLFKTGLLELFSTLQVDSIVIDEAHCISDWGHDFRPEYRQLATLKKHFPKAHLMALTATATPQVRTDICNILEIDLDDQFIAGFNRTNLFLQVVQKNAPDLQTLDFLQKHPNQSGIIYCFSRRQVDELSAFLADNKFSVKPYHAGLPADVRRKNQEDFIRDDVQIIVATIAFGMGINKSNVRFVIHFDLPKSIESYYQEIGRAGRDGVQADCLLLFSAGDAQKIRFFIDQKESAKQRQIAYKHLDDLLDYAETDDCRRLPLIRYFGDDYSQESCEMCDKCTSEKQEKVDITVAAQKFLSCVYRTDQLYGAGYIIDVLRGSAVKKVLANRHNLLSTYDIGKEYSKKQWMHLSRQFIRQKLLFKDAAYGSLKLTQSASEVMSGNQKIFGTLHEEAVKFKAQSDVQVDYDRILFGELRNLRKTIADAGNIPPFVVFSDKSLIDMAAYYPQSENNFLQMHGVGRAKMVKYGRTFMDAIRIYAHKNDKSEKNKSAPIKNMTRMSSKIPRHVAVSEAFKNGRSLKDLMMEYNVKQGTILNHLYRYIQAEGKVLDGERIKNISVLSEDQQKKALAGFDRYGTEQLRPVFDLFKTKVGYEELHIMRLVYLLK